MSSGNTIEQKLHLAWRQERRFVHLRGLCRFVLWLVAMIVLDFVIDWGLIFRSRFPEQIRGLLLLVNIGVLGYVLWNEWIRHLKPYDPLRAALEVEAKHPELASVLVSYTQLSGPISDQPNVSTGLIDAMRQQALQKTAPMDFREVIDFSQLKKLFVVAGVVIVFFGAISINWQEHFRSLMLRMAGVDATYPTRTQLASITGNQTVRAGDALEIMASVEGVIPGEGELYVRPVGGDDWQEVPMLQVQGTQYVRNYESVTEDFEYYVEIGDARSNIYRVSAVAAPQIVASELKMVFPKYMGRKDQSRQDDLDPEVPAGTQLTWRLTCDTAIKSLVVLQYKAAKGVKGKKQPEPIKIEATVDATGKIATFSTPSAATESFKYGFRWVERDNQFKYNDVQHTVRVVADKAPNIDLLRPSEGGIATIKKKIGIVADATDDHGLGGAWIVYIVDGKDEGRIPLKLEIGKQIQHTLALVDLPGVKLEAGMRISYAVEVADKSMPGLARRSKSAWREVSVVTDEQYTQWAQQFIAQQRDEIKRNRDDEQVSAVKIKQIRQQKTEVTP
jgi:hypothetical protein